MLDTCEAALDGNASLVTVMVEQNDEEVATEDQMGVKAVALRVDDGKGCLSDQLKAEREEPWWWR